MTGISAKKGSTSIYNQTLRYYNPAKGTAALYSGNISEWSSQQASQQQETYGFTYDLQGRLTQSNRYSGSSTTAQNAYTERGITYDKNGNILTLQRYAAALQDNYSYTYNGNKVTSISGTNNGTAISAATYSYDNNGNTTTDGLKNLQITYNILNLPQSVTQSGTTKATYGWFADGIKYSVLDAQGNGYYYIGSLIYSSTAGTTALESTDFSSGRIVLSGSAQTIHYHHKDHLGSVRAITNNSGAVIEQNAYYPFGGRHNFGQTYAQTTANRYKFNGKEQQTIGGLDLLDYGARMYDTKIARWLVQDPLAEKYYLFSPYNYCVNNPVMFVDPDGKAASPIYDTDGNLLGTDDNGLQGEAIIMDKDNFKQGMSHSEALEKNLGTDGLSSDESKYKFKTSFNSLSNRPDWDGYLTLEEANEWYRKGNGAPLYVDFRKLDLSKIDINNITSGKISYVNLQKHGKIFDEGLVYGTIGITKTTDNGIKSIYDNYDFDMKPWTGNSKRNIATIIGKLNAGNGVKYKINFYGTKY